MADLAAAGMPDRVLALVSLLTHREDQPRDEYLAAIRANADALVIKRVDQEVNSDPARLARLTPEEADALRKKYQAERAILFPD